MRIHRRDSAVLTVNRFQYLMAIFSLIVPLASSKEDVCKKITKNLKDTLTRQATVQTVTAAGKASVLC